MTTLVAPRRAPRTTRAPLVAAWAVGAFVLAGIGVIGLKVMAIALMAAVVAYLASFTWPHAYLAGAAALMVLTPWYWGPSAPGTAVLLTPSLLLACALIARFADRGASLRVGWADGLVAAYVAALFLASILLFGVTTNAAFTAFVGGPIAGFAAFRLLGAEGGRTARLALSSVLFAIAVAGALTIIERTTSFNPFIGIGRRSLATPETGLLERFGGVRAEGPFGQPVVASLVLAAGAVGSVARYLRDRGARWVVAGALCAGGALATQSRTGVAAALFGVALLAVNAARTRRVQGLFGIAAIVAVTVIGAGSDKVGELRDSLAGSSREAATVTHREELNAVLLDPSYFTWLGPGRETGIENISQVARLRSPVKDPASEWVRTYLVFGGITLGLLAAVSLAGVVGAVQRRESDRQIAFAMIATIAVGLFGVTLTGQLHTLFWALVGLAAAPWPDSARAST